MAWLLRDREFFSNDRTNHFFGDTFKEWNQSGSNSWKGDWKAIIKFFCSTRSVASGLSFICQNSFCNIHYRSFKASWSKSIIHSNDSAGLLKKSQFQISKEHKKIYFFFVPCTSWCWMTQCSWEKIEKKHIKDKLFWNCFYNFFSLQSRASDSLHGLMSSIACNVRIRPAPSWH